LKGSAADAYRWSDARLREIGKDARGDAGDGVVAGNSDFDDGAVKLTELPHFPQASRRHPGKDFSGRNFGPCL